MGSRGPLRTPTPILRARGSWLANHRSDDAPKPAHGRPTCPRWLKGEARKKWQQLMPLLEELGILAKLDGGALSRYAVLWQRWREMEIFLLKNTAWSIRRRTVMASLPVFAPFRRSRSQSNSRHS